MKRGVNLVLVVSIIFILSLGIISANVLSDFWNWVNGKDEASLSPPSESLNGRVANYFWEGTLEGVKVTPKYCPLYIDAYSSTGYSTLDATFKCGDFVNGCDYYYKHLSVRNEFFVYECFNAGTVFAEVREDERWLGGEFLGPNGPTCTYVNHDDSESRVRTQVGYFINWVSVKDKYMIQPFNGKNLEIKYFSDREDIPVIENCNNCVKCDVFVTEQKVQVKNIDTGSIECVINGESTSGFCSGMIEPICGDGYVNQPNEACDGSDFNGQVCSSVAGRGYSGNLRCNSNCQIDSSGCRIVQTQVCGNGIREGMEVCDGNDMNGQSCVSRGYEGGNLRCNSNCLGYDESLCTTCGDGVCDETETSGECPQDCGEESICGNTITETGEICDDGVNDGSGLKGCLECTCYDSDRGINYYDRGSTQDEGEIRISLDSCNENDLTEYYCAFSNGGPESYYRESEIYNCASEGKVCQDGACLESSCADGKFLDITDVRNSESGKIDIDVQLNGVEDDGVNIELVDSNTLITINCLITIFSCGAGSGSSALSCSYSTSCDYPSSPNGEYYVKVTDETCNELFDVYTIIDGSTLSCTDSDGGLNYGVRGTVNFGDFSFGDQCGMHFDNNPSDNPNLLNEKYCSGEMPAESLFDCSVEGKVCEDGACVDEEEITCGQEIRLVVDNYNQFFPSIYGDKVVYQDDRNGNYDIYMYDLSTKIETPISTKPFNQRIPSIYGNVVVWRDERNGNYDIYMYDIPTRIEKRITSDNDGLFPDIYGNKIVYYDIRNGDWDIYLYDILTGVETRITSNIDAQHNPDIYENKIVWEDYRNGGPDIYMYDISTGIEKRITTDNGYQFSSSIYGDKIVWQDDRNGNYDIYMYDILTGVETRITSNIDAQRDPVIYGNKIVWIDDRNGNYDIYMYDISTGIETPLSTNSFVQKDISIYGNNVVWEDYRNDGLTDIYMYKICEDPSPIGGGGGGGGSATSTNNFNPLKLFSCLPKLFSGEYGKCLGE